MTSFSRHATRSWTPHPAEAEALLQVGSMPLAFGFLSAARDCITQVRSVAPTDLRSLVNRANIAQQAGDHAESRRPYTLLLQHLPNHPTIRRNALV